MREFAKELDLSIGTVSNIGRRNLPSAVFLLRLAHVYGINLNWFLCGWGRMRVNPNQPEVYKADPYGAVLVRILEDIRLLERPKIERRRESRGEIWARSEDVPHPGWTWAVRVPEDHCEMVPHLHPEGLVIIDMHPEALRRFKPGNLNMACVRLTSYKLGIRFLDRTTAGYYVKTWQEKLNRHQGVYFPNTNPPEMLGVVVGNIHPDEDQEL